MIRIYSLNLIAPTLHSNIQNRLQTFWFGSQLWTSKSPFHQWITNWNHCTRPNTWHQEGPLYHMLPQSGPSSRKREKIISVECWEKNSCHDSTKEETDQGRPVDSYMNLWCPTHPEILLVINGTVNYINFLVNGGRKLRLVWGLDQYIATVLVIICVHMMTGKAALQLWSISRHYYIAFKIIILRILVVLKYQIETTFIQLKEIAGTVWTAWIWFLLSKDCLNCSQNMSLRRVYQINFPADDCISYWWVCVRLQPQVSIYGKHSFESLGFLETSPNLKVQYKDTIVQY